MKFGLLHKFLPKTTPKILPKASVKAQFKKGFTLIELLVVISIIGILSSIIVISVSSSNSKARDSRRLADANTIIKAVEQYRIDNGRYPSSGTGSWFRSDDSSWNNFKTLLAPYLNELPVDPINNGWPMGGGNGYAYVSLNPNSGPMAQSNGKWFALVILLENENSALSANDGVSLCGGTPTLDYGSTNNNPKIITMGASCTD